MWKRVMQRWLTAGALIPAAVMLTHPGRAQQVQTSGPLTVSRIDCQRLEAHQPADDATYRAGSDAGVAPADLPGSWGSGAGTALTTDITVDAGRYGGTGIPGTKLDTRVGSVTVDAKGQVSFNGQLLDQSQREAIYLACRKTR